jgi:hypothetical protein
MLGPGNIPVDSPRLAIVGGGPMCTYALERLAALLTNDEPPRGLCISIFERTGRFGAGEIHSDVQAVTSYMNRVASQITFAADESNHDATRLLPKRLRPTFIEWCDRKYRETGHQQYRLRPRDVPRRYLHGQALREMFDRYNTLLRGVRGVTINLYAAEVTDVACQCHDDAPFRLYVGGSGGFAVPADHVLFVTGHSHNHPARQPLQAVSRSTVPVGYIAPVYPLERRITLNTVPPGATVAVLGLGLTAVDIFLHLTEGRGGSFTPMAPGDPFAKLTYHPSGDEPAKIIGASPSGMLKSCRPDNAKAADATAREHTKLEHKPVFLTLSTLNTLKRTLGTPTGRDNGRGVRQLDFELHVFPLLVLEMALVYYKTLLGKAFGDEICRAVNTRYREFIITGGSSRDAGVDYLLEPVQTCFAEAAAYINATREDASIPADLQRFADMRVLQGFYATVFGVPTASDTSPWGHSTSIQDHCLNWRRLFDPLTADDADDGRQWQKLVIAFMERDHLNAAQGNLRNPVKAACDGVWRDLRPVLSTMADRGGLTPKSQEGFMAIYLRYYERMSNGTGLEPMRKVLALIEAGLLDVSLGPLPAVEQTNSSVRITGPVTGVVRRADVVIQGRMDPFDAELDATPLYPNLLKRGLIRRWHNCAASGSFAPGAIDLNEGFHPVGEDGAVDGRLTFLGAPAEGAWFFQLSAARPQSDSYVLNTVARWANELVQAIGNDAASASHP